MEVNFYESGFLILSNNNLTIAPENGDRIIIEDKLYFIQDRQFKVKRNKWILDIYLELVG